MDSRLRGNDGWMDDDQSGFPLRATTMGDRLGTPMRAELEIGDGNTPGPGTPIDYPSGPARWTEGSTASPASPTM
jgi:hypothetical protein